MPLTSAKPSAESSFTFWRSSSLKLPSPLWWRGVGFFFLPSPLWGEGRKRGRSYLQKQTATVHPQADQPQDQQHRRRQDDGAIKPSEQVHAKQHRRPQVGLQGPSSPPLDQLSHAVHGDRVHPHHHEGKRPLAPAAQVDEGV